MFPSSYRAVSYSSQTFTKVLCLSLFLNRAINKKKRRYGYSCSTIRGLTLSQLHSHDEAHLFPLHCLGPVVSSWKFFTEKSKLTLPLSHTAYKYSQNGSTGSILNTCVCVFVSIWWFSHMSVNLVLNAQMELIANRLVYPCHLMS